MAEHAPEILDKHISSLNLSNRVLNLLQKRNVRTIRELTTCSMVGLLTIRGFGRTSLKEVKRKLLEIGASLSDTSQEAAIINPKGSALKVTFNDGNVVITVPVRSEHAGALRPEFIAKAVQDDGDLTTLLKGIPEATNKALENAVPERFSNDGLS